jgi:hypothetical protein
MVCRNPKLPTTQHRVGCLWAAATAHFMHSTHVYGAAHLGHLLTQHHRALGLRVGAHPSGDVVKVVTGTLQGQGRLWGKTHVGNEKHMWAMATLWLCGMNIVSLRTPSSQDGGRCHRYH